MKTARSLKATWPQALWAFLVPLGLLVVSRWLLFEPYVIPSGSMIPTLLVHDHIFVNKLAYGIRYPFKHDWLITWKEPQPGEVIVFFYPENMDLFFVKRVIAVGGDRIRIQGRRLWVNDQEFEHRPLMSPEKLPQDQDMDESTEGRSVFENYEFFNENGHFVRFRKPAPSEDLATSQDLSETLTEDFVVPPDSLFVMGDNRDESSDSRSWGFVPRAYVLGRASVIWLACSDTLPTAPFLCDPEKIRFSRLLTFIHSSVN